MAGDHNDLWELKKKYKNLQIGQEKEKARLGPALVCDDPSPCNINDPLNSPSSTRRRELQRRGKPQIRGHHLHAL
jgi:hypothetical protein